MSNLQKLYAWNNCGIGDYGIRDLNLIELYANNNENITKLNHMTNLRILDASGECGIDEEGICNLKLIKLFKYGNKNLKKIILHQ